MRSPLRLGPAARARFGAAALATVLAIATSACTSTPNESAVFCDRLASATSSTGAETQFSEFDPERVGATTQELRELADIAPADMEPTMTALLELFEAIEFSSDDEAAALLIANELEMSELSATLTSYALDECGLFLQRAPKPTPTAAPLVSNE